MQKFQNLKAFENKKFKMAKKAELFLERAENIVRKGENAGYQHFLLFSQCFQDTCTSFFPMSLKPMFE